jgi:aminopeptidase N
LYISDKDKSAIHPNLRAAIFGIVIRTGGSSEYFALKKEWQTTTSVDGKEIILRALGRVQSSELLTDYLSLLFTEVSTQDMHTGAMALAANPKTRLGLWTYIKNNFESIQDRLGKNMVVLDRFLRLSLEKFADRETEKDIAKFFEGKETRGYDRTLNIVSDTILGRATYKERDAAIISEWLKTNDYL